MLYDSFQQDMLYQQNYHKTRIIIITDVDCQVWFEDEDC